MAATPPAIAVADTPPTPRHAGEASRHYTTRKNTRHHRLSRAADTPPPDTQDLHTKPRPSRYQRQSPLPSSAAPPQSPPSSTHTSPRKGIAKGKKPRISHQMDEATRVNSNHYGRQEVSNDQHMDRKPEEADASHMLPTPVSLPRKKQVPRKETKAAARVLFPPRPDSVEDAMPTPRKNRRGRGHVGFSLYDLIEDGGADSKEKVQIYTDSRDKVPELDPSEDNPFLDRTQEGQISPQTGIAENSRKRKQRHGVETNPQIEKAFDRDEGMVYVFRGKKIYRRFPRDSDSEHEDSPTALTGSVTTMNQPELPNLRPLTRSTIKPRLLFPTTQQKAERSDAALADEEAPTDIEDHSKPQNKEVVTPVKNSFEPVTPPTTGHATRSTTQKARDDAHSPPDHDMEDVEMNTPMGTKKISPFDSWARTKAGLGGAKQGKKREAEAMDRSDGEDAKRVRSDVMT